MSHAPEVDLLHGEEVDIVAKPHLLSFLKYHLFAAYLVGVAVFLGWAYSYLKSHEQLLGVLSFLDLIFGRLGMNSTEALMLILFWAILLLSGFCIGALWLSRMPFICMLLIGTVGTVLELYFLAPYEMLFEKPMVKLLLLGVSGVAGIVLTEVYRRGHTYILTNYRIITKKGLIIKEERELMYDKITDVYMNQGIIGRVFNFGTVISVSNSGLGEDPAQAFAVPVEQSIVSGVSRGGKRSQRPRVATYFSLHGISSPRKIRIIIGDRQLGTKDAPILGRIEGLLRDKGTREKRFGETAI